MYILFVALNHTNLKLCLVCKLTAVAMVITASNFSEKNKNKKLIFNTQSEYFAKNIAKLMYKMYNIYEIYVLQT